PRADDPPRRLGRQRILGSIPGAQRHDDALPPCFGFECLGFTLAITEHHLDPPYTLIGTTVPTFPDSPSQAACHANRAFCHSTSSGVSAARTAPDERQTPVLRRQLARVTAFFDLAIRPSNRRPPALRGLGAPRQNVIETRSMLVSPQ